MMLKEKLKDYHIILASASPRRQQFLREMGLDFEIRLKPVEEIYPPQLKAGEISDYLSKLKADAFNNELKANDILITSDTVVWHQGESLAKAENNIEAEKMLRKISGGWHQVITSVCFTTPKEQILRSSTTDVKFKHLSDEEIRFYVQTYMPFDKAGAYGIQEWLGLIGIKKIKGAYPNVVGLPTQLVYETLMHMIN